MVNMRKFDSNRTYNLVKWIVIIITVLCWLNFGQLYLNQKNTLAQNRQDYDKCKLENPDPNDMFCWRIWFASDKAHFNAYNNSSTIGLVLPIVFFGGSFLFKYLFPVKEKTKKEE